MADQGQAVHDTFVKRLAHFNLQLDPNATFKTLDDTTRAHLFYTCEAISKGTKGSNRLVRPDVDRTARCYALLKLDKSAVFSKNIADFSNWDWDDLRKKLTSATTKERNTRPKVGEPNVVLTENADLKKQVEELQRELAEARAELEELRNKTEETIVETFITPERPVERSYEREVSPEPYEREVSPEPKRKRGRPRKNEGPVKKKTKS